MCFSASASFTAAALLGGISTIAFKESRTKSEYLFSAIPLFFALQQGAEGVIWLVSESTIIQYAGSLFLCIAFFFWPIWIPYTTLHYTQAESDSLWRRILLTICLIVGLITAAALACYWLYYGMVVNAGGCNIMYHAYNTSPRILSYILSLLYASATVLPQIVTPSQAIQKAGILTGAGYVFCWWAYYNTFISVWCFFAALISICILQFLHDEHNQKQNNVHNVHNQHT